MMGALDLLIAVILVLFVPIGLWRGPAREAVTTGGILLGAILAGEWTPVWGPALTASTGLTPPLAGFFVAINLFLGVVLVIGYGGSLLLPPRLPGRWARAAGGPIALLNAALIIGYTLRFLQSYVYANAPNSFIMQSTAGWLLANLVAIIFLLPVLVLTPAVAVAAIVRLGRWLRGGSRRPAAAPTAALPRLDGAEATHPIQRPAGPVDATPPEATMPMALSARQPADGEDEKSRPCPACGREVAAGARFCRHCGRSL